MLTGVCKLTVDAIVLAPRSFINFGNSNGRGVYTRGGMVRDAPWQKLGGNVVMIMMLLLVFIIIYYYMNTYYFTPVHF